MTPVTTCPACGVSLKPHMRFCNMCGTEVPRQDTTTQEDRKKKFCPQCGAPLRPELKYCENCGTAIDKLPRCPRCGDPVSPGERFCNMCGLPLTGDTKAAAPSPAPAVPTPARAPAPAAALPGSAKTGGLPFGKIIAGVVIVFILFVIVIAILPDGGGTTTTGDTVDDAATRASIQQAETLKENAIQAVRAGDAAALRSMLTASTLAQTGSAFAIPPADAQAAADALGSAKITAAYPDIVFYEMESGGSTESFYITQEEGEWKISGF